MLSFGLSELLTKGGYTLIVLIGCSILSLKMIIEKWIALSGLEEKNINDLSAKFKESLEAKNYKEAVQLTKTSQIKRMGFKVAAPLSNIYFYILQNAKHKKEDLLDLAYSKMDQEMMKLEKGLGILGTLGNISPFIGLFGTVLGIIRSFEGLSMGQSTAQGSGLAVVMSGIAEALISTAAGLIVAVPAVIFYNYFVKKIKRSIPDMEREIKEIVYFIKKGDA
jgi:biopolymer transport protein ExbB